MGRFLLWVAIVAGGFWLASQVGLVSALPLPSLFSLGGTGTRVEGRQVVRDAGDLEVRFQQVGSLDDAYMLFGGQVMGQRNSVSHAALAGLPMRHARLIAASYPDFHMCKSPGAAQAKASIEDLNLVAANGSARATLEKALDTFQDRLRNSGPRTCIHVRGAPLMLDSVRVQENGEDITGQLPPAFTQAHYVLAEGVEIQDCEALLR